MLGELMARLYKIELYLCDINDMFEDKDDVLEYLNSLLETDDYLLNKGIINAKESKEFTWYDDIDLNDIDCPKEECEKYFD